MTERRRDQAEGEKLLTWRALRDRMTRRLSDEEIRTLCYDLAAEG